MRKIPFNKPYVGQKEIEGIHGAILKGHVSGNGYYTKICHDFFREKWGFGKCLLTTSCTDALEMCALLLNIKSGDEVIVPSYTFVSTALAFVRQGAKIVFADSRSDHPGIDEDRIESLITPNTKAIVPVHYAGVPCDMAKIMAIAEKHGIVVVEEAAQGINAYHNESAVGSMGHLAVFSFHETKNLHCGEGGLLVLNDANYVDRAEIMWEKGTNRAKFFRGEVDKYTWVDLGSSFLPSDMLAGFLYGQLQELELIQRRRLEIWNWYFEKIDKYLEDFSFQKPTIPSYAKHNAHMFYLVCSSGAERSKLIEHLRRKGIHAVFHYMALHDSPFHKQGLAEEGIAEGSSLRNCLRYQDCLVRLPLYFELDLEYLDQLFLG